MDKRIIFHLIFAVVVGGVYYLFFEGATLIQAIIFAIVYVVLSLLLDLIRDKRQGKQKPSQITTIDQEAVQAFIEAMGGIKNIESTDAESSRVKVVVKDVDSMDQEKLKALALDGAYLSGNQLQVTMGTNSSEFSRQIREAIE